MTKPVSWKDILGNPYTKSPDVRMLEGGHVQTEKRGIKGGAKSDVSRLFIRRDREYLVAWLARKVIIPLGIHSKVTSYNDFQKLIREAIDYAKTNDNDQQGSAIRTEEEV